MLTPTIDQATLKAQMLNTPKKIFVFEGGGAKGLVYAGALNIADKAGLLQHLEKVAGSSAGGITAFLVATGHSAAQIEKIMMELDLTEIQDSKPIVQAVNSTANFVNETAKVMVPVYGFGRYLVNKESPLQMGDAGVLAHSLANACYGTGEFNGAWQGKAFIELARKILKEKLGVEKLSFAQLHQLRTQRPELGIKDLYLTGTDAKTKETVVFSHENPETKDVDIVDALRATMSFPFAFEAHEIEINGIIRRFIDGGVKNNFPMNIFDLTDSEGCRIPNPEVLGFKVDDKEECQTLLFKDDITNKEKKIGNFSAISHDGDVYKYYRYNTVQIYDADVWTLNFDLDPLTKLILKLSGEESMKAFLKEGYQTKSMHDNVLINTLMRLGNDLNNGNYLDAQKALMFLQAHYSEICPQVAQIVIKVMENFKISGLMPGATAAYAALIKEALTLAQIKQVESKLLPATRDGAFAAAGVAAPLLAFSCLNPITAPLIPLAGGAVFLYKYLSHGKAVETKIEYSKELVKKFINERNFEPALVLIRSKIDKISLEELTEIKVHFEGLKSKGFWNQTRSQYDTLKNYLDVQHQRLQANVDTEKLADSFEKLGI